MPPSTFRVTAWSGAWAAAVLVGCASGTVPDGGDAGADPADGGLVADAGTGGDGGVVARDLDLVVVRLNSDGTLDTSFGDAGIARLDFGQATGGARDQLWSLDHDAQSRIVLFGSTKALGRPDTDRLVVRLTVNGELDSTFATNGVFRMDIANANDSTRHGFVQADGKIVSAGYMVFETGVPLADGGVQTTNCPVLLRLNSDGSADSSFGDQGRVYAKKFRSSTGPWGFAEAYAVGQQSTGKYVTTGYGRVASTGPMDQASFRYLTTGAEDLTWSSGGNFLLDLIGGDERGRHVVVLADDRVLQFGSATPLSGNVDALVSLVTAEGVLDPSFNAVGYKTWSFGRNDEAFFGGAVAPGGLTLAAAGYRVGSANTAAENDDAVLLVYPLSTGGAQAFAQPVPLSTTSHDRFFGVAWDQSKIVATGFVREGSDTRLAVARFKADGTLDTTFGATGVVTVNATVGGGTEETARWVTVLANGKIVIAGHAEHQ
jgi:uncharacterized delta-60 repeat protein